MNFLKKIGKFFNDLFNPMIEEKEEEITICEQPKVKPLRTQRKWLANEVEALVQLWITNHPIETIAYVLDRTVFGVQRKLSDLGYSLKKGAPRKTKAELAAESEEHF